MNECKGENLSAWFSPKFREIYACKCVYVCIFDSHVIFKKRLTDIIKVRFSKFIGFIYLNFLVPFWNIFLCAEESLSNRKRQVYVGRATITETKRHFTLSIYLPFFLSNLNFVFPPPLVLNLIFCFPSYSSFYFSFFLLSHSSFFLPPPLFRLPFHQELCPSAMSSAHLPPPVCAPREKVWVCVTASPSVCNSYADVCAWAHARVSVTPAQQQQQQRRRHFVVSSVVVIFLSLLVSVLLTINGA